MAHKIIVRTEKGRPDSLREPVQIVFTLTPADLEGFTRSYDPVAVGHMTFPIDSEEQQAYEWGPEFAFDLYSTQLNQGRNTCIGQGYCTETSPGQMCHLALSNGAYTSLSSGDSLLVKHLSVKVLSRNDLTQDFALKVRNMGSHFNSIVAYHNSKTVVASANLLLQAYVVDGEGNYNGDILTPEHLTRPLFDKPLDCKFLPVLSTWRLSQDPSGAILLTTDGPSTPPDTSGPTRESITELRDQLTALLTALGATQQRLATIEAAVANNHADLSSKLNTTREQVTRLDQVVPAVQAKVAEFEAFAARTEGRARASLSDRILPHPVVHKSAAEVGKKSGPAEGRRSMVVDGKSAADAQDQSSPTATQATGLPSAATFDGAYHGGISQPADHQAPIATEESTEVGGSTQTLQARATSKEAPSRVRDSFILQDSLHVLRQQIAGLDRRVPALEVRSDKLTKGFGQTRESLASMQTFLRSTGERVVRLEAEVPAMGDKMGELTETVATTGDYLADLASRLTIMEGRVEGFAESLADIRESRGRDWPSPSLTENPSVGFPSGVADSSHPPIAESLLWFSLPQPLDSEEDEHRMG